ncbi:MAG TPA: hypothetical protein VIB00_05050, partial [Pyrinomonadaceae bacterium]
MRKATAPFASGKSRTKAATFGSETGTETSYAVLDRFWSAAAECASLECGGKRSATPLWIRVLKPGLSGIEQQSKAVSRCA